jgi:hypothetical protein
LRKNTAPFNPASTKKQDYMPKKAIGRMQTTTIGKQAVTNVEAAPSEDTRLFGDGGRAAERLRFALYRILVDLSLRQSN